jgi:tetratricopeptide (TPR) repeat protein
LLTVLSGCPDADLKPTPPPPPPTGEMSAKIRSLENRVRQSDTPKAMEELEAQLAVRPRDLSLQFLIAWVGAPSENSFQGLHRIAADAPKDPWCHYGMARIYTTWKIFDQAQKELDQLFAVEPRFVPGFVADGALLRARGSLDESKSAYQEALRLAPSDVDALSGLGVTLIQAGEETGGKAALEKALALDPNCYEAVSALAALAVKGPDLDGALKLQAKLAELAPADRSVQMTLGSLEEKKGDARAAIAAYEAAQKIALEINAARALVRLYNQLGDKDGETHALDSVVRLDGKDAEAHIRLAELKSDDAQAVDLHLKAASEGAASNPELRLRLARLLEKQDDYVAALEDYRAALAAPVKDDTAAASAKSLEAKLQLSPLAGDLNKINRAISTKLTSLFRERQKDNPQLSGKYQVRVNIDDKGKAKEVTVVEDSVHDPLLLGYVYFQLKDAQYPKQKRTPTFEFDLSGLGKD